MYKPLILITLLLGSSFAVLDVSSIDVSVDKTEQEKPSIGINYIPFKEVATVIIDQKNNKVKISYSLMSKDKEDFQIPDKLETKILNTEKISTIIYTNTENCAPGIINDTCILINIPTKKIEDVNFKEKQKITRETADLIIDDLNQVLGINAEFHSVVIQTKTDLTSVEGAVLSAVYTVKPTLPTKLLFNILILENITEEIRFAGGFFNHAKKLTENENSIFTFSMSAEQKRMLYAAHISVITHGKIGLNNLSPLAILTEDELNRSKLFAEGFYPLNSIINVIIFSEEEQRVSGTNSAVISSISNTDELQKNGWYFISSKPSSDDEINKLDMRYLFGKSNSVDREELLLSIDPIVQDVTLNDVSQNDVSENGGGCLIATATFGSEMTPQVQFLREIRDNTVLQTESGSAFMTGFNQFYYSFSPAIADYERENPMFKEVVKLTLAPLLTSLTLLQYVDIDSESEMLGYGIGVILLNIGMYFIAPAILVMKIRKLI
jgi:hypothetical protein